MRMASTDIYTERDTWSTPLGLSVALHGMLFAAILIYGAVLGHLGSNWGGDSQGGEALGITIVSNIPLPHPDVETQNIVANQSKGLTQSEPKAEEKPEPKAIPVPETIKTPKKPRPSKITPVKPVQPPPSVVPYGQGGPVNGPYETFNISNGKGGFAFKGGNGDFGSRYAWYVRQIQQKISDNWYKYEIDPNVVNTNKVFVTFDVDRSGRPHNVQIEQSSGVPSVDQSAIRAIQRVDTFGPLPQDYYGSYVNVEFWFDANR